MFICNISPLSFKEKYPIKELYKKGKLPMVKYGFYGGLLNKRNVTGEHILPKSKGGKTTLQNIALATKELNNERGNHPLSEYLNKDNLNKYLNQFKDVVVDWFNGNSYIEMINDTVSKVLKRGL